MKYLIVVCMLLSWSKVAAQHDVGQLMKSFPLEGEKNIFVKNIWLGKMLWESIDDQSGRLYFYTRSQAKTAEIKLIPVFTPSKLLIDGYDSTKNILDFLIADPGRCYLAMISKKGMDICLIQACKGGANSRGRLETIVENIEDNKRLNSLYAAFSGKYPLYYDNAIKLYCRIQDNTVFVFQPYETQWVPYYHIIGKDGLAGYKQLVKSQAIK